MKPLSELVKELRGLARERLLLSQQVADARARGLFEAADSLQAWLKEADAWTWRETDDDGDIYGNHLRRDLLGTTQKPKQEGEK